MTYTPMTAPDPRVEAVAKARNARLHRLPWDMLEPDIQADDLEEAALALAAADAVDPLRVAQKQSEQVHADFMANIDNPPPATEALKQLFRDYHRHFPQDANPAPVDQQAPRERPSWDRECVVCGCKWMAFLQDDCPRCSWSAPWRSSLGARPSEAGAGSGQKPAEKAPDAILAATVRQPSPSLFIATTDAHSGFSAAGHSLGEVLGQVESGLAELRAAVLPHTQLTHEEWSAALRFLVGREPASGPRTTAVTLFDPLGVTGAQGPQGQNPATRASGDNS